MPDLIVTFGGAYVGVDVPQITISGAGTGSESTVVPGLADFQSVTLSRITLDGVDITANVLFESTTFTAKVNGQVGNATIRVRDIDHTFLPVVGKRIVLEIAGGVKWSGYVASVTKAYAFPAEDTADAAAVLRIWEIAGVDDNILFDKRVVFDSVNPATHLDFEYLPGTWDDTIIKDIATNYLDLSSDNISFEGVKRVSKAILDIPGIISKRGTKHTLSDYESTTHTGSIANAGFTWAQTMDIVQRATGAIYYLDGVSRSDRRILRYVDVETVTSDYALTDTPNLSVQLGDPDPNDPVGGDTFTRTIAPSTTGNARWGVSDGGFTYQTPFGTGGYDGPMGVNGSAGTIEIRVDNDDHPWQGTAILTEPVVSTILRFRFRVSDIPSAPPTGQGGGAHDDIGWRTVISMELRMGQHDVANIRIGSYAPPFWGPDQGSGPIGDWENPCVTLWSNFGEVGPDVTVLKSDWVANTWYSLVLEYDPDNGVHRIKVWESADPEPGAWLLSRDSTGGTSYALPPATNDYGINLVWYRVEYWDIAGTDTATIEVDNFDINDLAVPGTPVPIVNPILNPGFEDGLANWSPVGDVGVVGGGVYPTPYEGTYEARLNGLVSAASISQRFVIPDGGGVLSFWWQGVCAGASDGFLVTLVNISTAITATLVGPICSTETAWQQVTFDVSGMNGDVVELRFLASGAVMYIDPVEVIGSFPAPFYPPTALNRLNGVGGQGEPYGYREFSLVENGSHLTNDMHIWGAALGVKLMVHSRTEDATSISGHGRWQDGLFTNGLYKQVSANLVSASYVNGTPQSHRGRKNDQVTFSCRTLMPVFRVGEVVAVSNSIFSFAARLPLREMRISFFSPTLPIFDLILGHEIDQPWSFYESLRKMPRPIEIRLPNWYFPVPFRLPYCPLPTLAEVALGTGTMQSIFQRDFLGPDAETESPPLWQNPPWPSDGGAWYTGTTARGLTDTIGRDVFVPYPDGYGFVGFANASPANSSIALLRLRTPASGAVEILVAAQLGDNATLGTIGSFVVSNGVNSSFEIGTTDGEVFSVQTSVISERIAIAGANTGLRSQWSGPSTTTELPISMARQPLWIRVVWRPNQYGFGGTYAKVWPRSKPEPDEWTSITLDSDISLTPYTDGSQTFQNLGPWNSVIDFLSFTVGPGQGLGFGMGNSQSQGGFEAISVYAEPTGTFPLHWYGKIPDANSASGTFGTVQPVGGMLWWEFADNYFASSRYTTSADGLPNQYLNFVWPQFLNPPPWDTSLLYLQNVTQNIVSFKMGQDFPAIGFTQKTPDTVTISGEVWIEDSGGLYRFGFDDEHGTENIQFPVLLSFNEYDFGASEPFWYPGGAPNGTGNQYEAAPSHRNYFLYQAPAEPWRFSTAIPQLPKYWMPFEFTTFPLSSDILQWGVTWVSDIQQQFRDNISSQAPPGRFFLPTTATISLQFRNIQYKANYITEPDGAYFCVPSPMLPIIGDVVGLPARDSGDQLTYLVGSGFVAGSTKVWVNGAIQQMGATEQYIEHPGQGEIVFNSALDPDDEVIVDFEGIGPIWDILP